MGGGRACGQSSFSRRQEFAASGGPPGAPSLTWPQSRPTCRVPRTVPSSHCPSCLWKETHEMAQRRREKKEKPAKEGVGRKVD